MSVLQKFLILLMRVYRLTISPTQAILLGESFGCRFTPTCSAYALEALQKHGAVDGSVLTVKRLCRCHPFGGCGHDPVPEALSATDHAPTAPATTTTV